ncbi:carboxy terminal-processing peptidase [Candidatus Hamiltonella defensa]|uniref:Carboxy-terminal protease for penicillin-binding protein 3 n=1 Tax=Hamiltonella defensa subsp. Acyrthosiphon pisum (strain 5AT) TaxID=572265 RepID=C4K6B2_HAMD5|nr:carboxy-terminal protease for penicillin-binding protein 3 [Candidatus Hamiltonella defensa 5AT (Acyrthosiphon pisum)]ACQ68110.1 carboxy-terminal protease for penicillin-binding protein 3 [Candidatus Hamiltonella defensa 5AT (Acyrthosiphon pisum)]ATW22716.1 C-terminal processing peptidase [Candidatus Hamiltonella defensa]ATW22721.1 C-terminal processing peptidase [Candidatus Hamiltonella defensa]
MNKLMKLRFTTGLFFLYFVFSSYAKSTVYNIESLPQLHQEVQHATVSQRVVSHLMYSHYRQFNLDQAFSNKIFDCYLNMLDPRHNILLTSDLDPFMEKKSFLANELKSGHLSMAYDLFNIVQKRRFERYQYALSLLEKPMMFTGKDSIEVDRSNTPWPSNENELNHLWDLKVKFEQLNLKLAGKTDSEIKKTLIKRYHFALKNLIQTNNEDVFQIIMNAFARELDPHTSYLSPRNTDQFNIEISLSLEGIGAVLQTDGEYTTIRSMIPDGPAAKSKVLSVGDHIVGVGQMNQPIVDVVGWRLDNLVALIKGPKGTKVRLEILSGDKNKKPKTVTLTREFIKFKDRAVKMSVKSTGKGLNKEKIGILKIPGFYIGLTQDVKKQLQQAHNQHLSGIVIDLRGNGGGALTEAVALSGLFISGETIVQIKDNHDKIREQKKSDSKVYYKGPLVVLVDRHSASASEIFAAAMQDYGRALIVGERTFGKGTVQQHRSLNSFYDRVLHPEWPEMGSIQYTIQKFYRVNGGSTQIKGVIPDILMPTEIDPSETGESFEKNALPWDSIQAIKYTKQPDLESMKPILLKSHKKRIQDDPEFKNIEQDIARYHIWKTKKNTVSLNYIERMKENMDEDRIRLERLNQRFIKMGKKPLNSLKQLPKDYQPPDPYLDESVHIAIDLAHLKKGKKSFKTDSIYQETQAQHFY